MSLFDDLSRFLESRLDEFLKANPHLELQALEDQLRGQEESAIALFADLKRRENQLEEGILSTAQAVQRWHARIEKAKAAGRQDLVTPAQEREAALLRQGNHLWGQMKGVKERLEQTRLLQQRVKAKRQEVKAKIAQAEAARASSRATETASSTAGWNQSPYRLYNQPLDPLEETFQRWETEAELDELKRKMGR
ncbi:MAG: TIGR04376 family protein [Leptolyngbya sp. SIO4C1]|nr:TIGR04376 family protein [Leptolyngbya sp. SIO4C1]